MTKGEAYRRHGLSIDGANFNPQEVADEKFIDGCKALRNLKKRMIEDKVEENIKNLTEKYGEEKANAIHNVTFVMALLEATHSMELVAVVTILLDNGCPLKAVMRALDFVFENILEEDKSND